MFLFLLSSLADDFFIVPCVYNPLTDDSFILFVCVYMDVTIYKEF